MTLVGDPRRGTDPGDLQSSTTAPGDGIRAPLNTSPPHLQNSFRIMNRNHTKNICRVPGRPPGRPGHPLTEYWEAAMNTSFIRPHPHLPRGAGGRDRRRFPPEHSSDSGVALVRDSRSGQRVRPLAPTPRIHPWKTSKIPDGQDA